MASVSDRQQGLRHAALHSHMRAMEGTIGLCHDQRGQTEPELPQEKHSNLWSSLLGDEPHRHATILRRASGSKQQQDWHTSSESLPASSH